MEVSEGGEHGQDVTWEHVRLQSVSLVMSLSVLLAFAVH